MSAARGVLAALAALALLAGCASTTVHPQGATRATTVVLVRHAEKAVDQGNDPALTAAGQRRAARVAWMLADLAPNAIFATEWRRTRQTVVPLSTQSGVTITEVPAADIDGLAQRIRADHRGQTVVVAAHSNTVPAIIRALGSEVVPEIQESDYTNLFIVTLPEHGPGTTVRLHFANDNAKP